MDLANLKASDVCKVDIKHPVTGENLGLSVDICGSDSKRFQAAKHKVRNESLKNPGKQRTSEQLEATSLSIVLDCVTGWAGEWIYKGSALEFSRQNLEMVLKELPWIREQIDTAIGDRTNFLGQYQAG